MSQRKHEGNAVNIKVRENNGKYGVWGTFKIVLEGIKCLDIGDVMWKIVKII